MELKFNNLLNYNLWLTWCILVMEITFQQLKSMWNAWNLANIVNLLDFPACPAMNLIGNEFFKLAHVCKPRW
jgi:hypothetical protein